MAAAEAAERQSISTSLDPPFERDELAFDRLIDSIEKLGPKDIDAFASKYFKPVNRVDLTLIPEKNG